MPNDTADGRSTADPWSPAGKKNACIIVAGIAVAIVVLIAALLASGVLNDDSKHGGQCGDNVYYRYDESTKTLDIFVNGQGNGVMNDYDESKAE